MSDLTEHGDIRIGDLVEHTNSRRQGRVTDIKRMRDDSVEFHPDCDFHDIWWKAIHVRKVDEVEQP